MGNEITIQKQILCSQCHNPLPYTSWRRNQYIEGSEYTVHHATDMTQHAQQKYFEPVSKEANAKVQYYCFKCMFKLTLDPFQCPNERRNVDEEESLTFENLLITETYQNINATHQRTVASFKNNFSDLHFQDTVCECSKMQIDKQFYESLVKRLWVERKTLENEVLDTLQKKLSSPKKNSVDRVLGSLFKKYLQNTQSGKHDLLENFDELFNRYADPKFLHSLREQINSYFRADKDWLVSILLDLYVHFSHKTTGPIAEISNHVCDIVVEWTGYLPSRDELSSFILSLISICARVGTHEVSSLEKLSRDHFQDSLFQSSRHENAKWVRHCSNDHIRKKISTSVLSEYSEFLCNIFQSHPWSMDKFDQLLYILQRRFKFDKPYLKECLEILQYHGLSNINFVLKCIEECPVKQVSSMLKQVALSSKNLPVHHLLTEFNIINNVNEALIEKCKFALESIKMTIINLQHHSHHADFYDSERFRLFFESQFQDTISFKVEECKKMYFLASAACAVFKVKKYKPRDVQLLSAILYLLYEEKSGLLLQIHTGEGKSCIIAMIAATLVLVNRDTDKTVDIITSSGLLATRDFNDWRDFFEFLDITSSQNVNVVGESKCYCNKIVFGTVETFSADYLRHDFQQTKLRGKRQFDMAIVDEVDSILLDKGIQFTYLTQMVAVMKHLEPILAIIWYHASEIEKIYSTENNMFFQGSPLPFYVFLSNILMETLQDESSVHKYVMHILDIAEDENILPNGFSKKYNQALQTEPLKVTELLNIFDDIDVIKFLKLCERELEVKFQVFKMYRRYNVCVRASPNEPSDLTISTLNVLSLNNGYVCDLHDDFQAVLSMIETKVYNQIIFSKGEQDNKGTINKVPIPLYLEHHVKTQMKTWIYNAFEAKKMQPNREYLVKDNAIHPIDFKHTGIIESNKKWGDGLQQFLEMKHLLALSPMTLITNFLSNVALFKKYSRIYGLSGTIGSRIDEGFLETVYGIHCYKIPTHKSNKKIDLGGVLKHSREEWLLEICDTIKRECKLENSHCSRAALVIVEDILTATLLKSEIQFQNTIPINNVKLYTRSETDERDVIKQSLQQGEVIVATNLAGRGTNITVSDKVNENGGLFVLLTFLPFNERVELQAKGRTSRKGEPGSTKMILLSETLEKNLSSGHNFTHVMQLREENEWQNMMFITKEIELVLLKDSLFQTYCETINDLRPKNARTEENIQILHEKWGFWLKHKSVCIEKNPDCNLWKEKLIHYLRDVQNELVNETQTVKKEAFNGESQRSSIYHIIRLGNSKLFSQEYEMAKKYFTRAIETDEIWSSIAYYNRAFCTLQLSKHAGMKEAIDDLNKALSLLHYYFNELTVTTACIQSSRVKMEGDEEGEGNLKEQIESKFQLLNFWAENIMESVKKLVEIQKLNLSITVHSDDIFSTISVFQDTSFEDFLFEVWQLGLTQILAVDKKPRITLEQVIVIGIGALQVSVGAILIPLSVGVFSKIAVGLVSAGLSDVIEGSLAMVRGKEFSWRSWGLKKGLTLATICLMPCVMKYGKVGCAALFTGQEEGNLISITYAVNETVVTDATRIASFTNATTATQETFKTIGQTLIVGVAEGIKELVTNTAVANFLKECREYIIKNSLMDKSVELTRKSLQDYFNPALGSLFAEDEMKMIIIRMKIYFEKQRGNKSTCSQDCSSFKKIGKDVLSNHLEANKKKLEWQNKIIGFLLRLIDPMVSKITEYFDLKDVVDICKEGIKCGGTIFHSSSSAWSIKGMASETCEVFKKGIQEKLETMEIPLYKKIVDHRLEHDKQLNDDLSELAAHFSQMICDFYADLFQQYVIRKCYDYVKGKVKSSLCKHLQINTKKPNCIDRVKKAAKFVEDTVKQKSAGALTGSDGSELILETDNYRIRELEKAKKVAIKHNVDLHILTDDGTGKLSEMFHLECNSKESKSVFIVDDGGRYSKITGQEMYEQSLCEIIELERYSANKKCEKLRKQNPEAGVLHENGMQHTPFKRQTITMKFVNNLST